jgi:hypothetical protein
MESEPEQPVQHQEMQALGLNQVVTEVQGPLPVKEEEEEEEPEQQEWEETVVPVLQEQQVPVAAGPGEQEHQVLPPILQELQAVHRAAAAAAE